MLTGRLDALRATMSADARGMSGAGQVSAGHAELSRLLGDAVADAIDADSVGADLPPGISSWMAEGLARSQERELALLAATDVIGVAQVLTVESPRWGS